jgi:hypothetical protein
MIGAAVNAVTGESSQGLCGYYPTEITILVGNYKPECCLTACAALSESIVPEHNCYRKNQQSYPVPHVVSPSCF